MLEYLYRQEKAQIFEFGFPALKDIFHYITVKIRDGALHTDIDKEKSIRTKSAQSDLSVVKSFGFFRINRFFKSEI